MASTRLELLNENVSPNVYNSNVAVITDIPIECTFQIAEVREPESGTGSYSNTIDIPGTPEVNQFFEDLFSLNVDLQKFNPNLKVRAVYYVDELEVFDGYLQVISIELDESTKSHVYKCNILGEVLTLFKAIKGKYLTDLYNYATYTTYPPLNIYNHALTAAVISTSWTTANSSPGVSYVYPVLDRGHAQSFYAGASGLSIEQYAGNGCFFAKTYVDRIFEQAGFTYTSSFFNSTYFKNLIVTPTKIPELDSTTLANNKFLANYSANQTFTKTLTQAGTQFLYNSTAQNILIFNNTVYDNFPRYNNVTGVYTPGVTKNYKLEGNIVVDIQFFDSGAVDRTSTTNALSGNITFGIVYGGTQIPALTSFTLGSGGNNVLGVTIPNQLLIASSQVFCYLTFNNLIVENLSYVITSMKVTVTSGAFSSEFSSPTPYVGQNIDANDLIPENYLQYDFLTDLRKMHNLYFTVDKNNPNNLIVEPRVDFYSSTAVDWSTKHDKNSIVDIRPIGELDNIKYKFTYSQDGDYFNKDYEENFNEVYGTEEVDITNDFITNEKEIKINLAPTPLVGNNYVNGMVLSTWRQQDLYEIKEFKAKPRILYWGGYVSASNNAKPVKFAFNNQVYNYYPYAGHMDNPFNPTIDLNFGLVSYVYYIKPNQYLTNNNLYNKYYSQYINQITDKNSKVIKTRFYLTHEDIHRFEFKYPVFCIINNEQGYYLVNYIRYNPLVDDTSEVELLKLTDYDIFSPEAIEFNNGLGTENSGNQRSANNNVVPDPDNTSLGESSMIIGGSGNWINEESSNVELFNSTDVILQDTVDNFMGVGLGASSVIESDSINVYDSLKVYGGADGGVGATKPRVLGVTSDFSIDGTIQIYEIDLDSIGVDITCTWDVATYPVMVTFKIVSNTGGLNFIIDETSSPAASPAPTLDGNALPFTTGLIENESITVYSNGTNLYII